MGKFVVKETKTGFHFNLVAGNGQVIGSSEVYTTMAALNKGIESVRKNALAPVEDQTAGEELKNPKFELYQDKAGEYRFRLKASNGEIIAVGEGYTTKANCKNGIASIGRNAPDAEVVEED